MFNRKRDILETRKDLLAKVLTKDERRSKEIDLISLTKEITLMNNEIDKKRRSLISLLMELDSKKEEHWNIELELATTEIIPPKKARKRTTKAVEEISLKQTVGLLGNLTREEKRKLITKLQGV